MNHGIFDLLSMLLIPVLMIVTGWLMRKFYPRNINYILGYRTKRSTVNQDTWKFGNIYCGRLYERIGWTLLPLLLILICFLLNASEEILGRISVIIMFSECILLLIPILLAERALKEKFPNV